MRDSNDIPKATPTFLGSSNSNTAEIVWTLSDIQVTHKSKMVANTGSEYVMSQNLTFCAWNQRHSTRDTQLYRVDEHIETKVNTSNAQVVVKQRWPPCPRMNQPSNSLWRFSLDPEHDLTAYGSIFSTYLKFAPVVMWIAYRYPGILRYFICTSGNGGHLWFTSYRDVRACP